MVQAASALEEVVVTAQKRSETILSVPISITAMSQETLDRAGHQGSQRHRTQHAIPEHLLQQWAGLFQRLDSRYHLGDRRCDDRHLYR